MADDVIDPNTYGDISKQWTEFLNQPGGRAAILSAGLALSQPRHWGQDNFGHLMSAIGTGGEAVGRVEEMNRRERETTAKEDVAQARLETATAKSGQAATHAQSTADKIAAQKEIANVKALVALRGKHDAMVKAIEDRYAGLHKTWETNKLLNPNLPEPVKPRVPSWDEYVATNPEARGTATSAGYQVPIAQPQQSGGIPRLNSPAEAAGLPRGSQFYDSAGNLRTVP